MAFDETAALRRSQAGDPAAFEDIIVRYYTRMVRLAYLLTSDRALAEDLAQEGFLQAYLNLHQFHLDRPFGPWITRIVMNLARQQYRRQRHNAEVSLDHLMERDGEGDLRGRSSDPVEHAQQAEERATITAALDHLTPRQREAIVLRYYGNFSDQELATALGCRPDAARQRIRNGLQALEAVIRQHYPWLITDLPNSLLAPPNTAKEAAHDSATH